MRPPNTQGFLRRKNLIKFSVLCFDPISSHQTENNVIWGIKIKSLKLLICFPVSLLSLLAKLISLETKFSEDLDFSLKPVDLV